MKPGIWAQAHPAEAQWLSAYQGDFPFYLSLREQLERKGELSPRQTEALTRAVQRDAKPVPAAVAPTTATATQAAPPVPQTFSVRPGMVLELRSWIAQEIAKEVGLEVGFRNVEIVEVKRETERAWLACVRYVSKICQACHVCGMHLDTEISRACGIGPTCAKRLGFKRAKLADAFAILEKLEAECARIGTLPPRWIPKSQVVARFEPGELDVLQNLRKSQGGAK